MIKLTINNYLLVLSLSLASMLIPDSASAEGLSWESLSAQQQEMLASMKEGWNDLPPYRQERLSKGADKWATMSPEQREQTKDRKSVV